MKCIVPASLALVLSGAHADTIGVSYFLPKAKIAVSVSQLLKSCPDAADRTLEVETSGAILVRYDADPDRAVKLDFPTGNLFVGRSMDLKLRDNGTLETANAEIHGAGGVAVAALFKAATAVLNAVAPIAAREPSRGGKPALCRPDITRLVLEAQRLRDAIDRLQTDGKGSTADLQTRLTAVEDRLTLTAQIAVPVSGADTRTRWQADIAPLDYSSWFNDEADKRPLAAMKSQNGYAVTVTADAAQLNATRALPRGSDSEYAFSYLMAVPASVSVCTKTAAGCEVLAAASASLPQLSPVFHIPLTGGVFSNRTLSISLNANGTPSAIAYKSASELAEISTAMSGAADAIEARRQSAENERQRRITEDKSKLDLLTAEKKLDNFLNNQN